MTPQEMVTLVRSIVGRHADVQRDLESLDKAFDKDARARSLALWEAFAAGALDLTGSPRWWEHLSLTVYAQPFDRVVSALATLPALYARCPDELSVVRGLARSLWSVDSFCAQLARDQPDTLRAHWDALPAEAQAACGAHLLAADTWGEAPPPEALVARAAEGFVVQAHPETLHRQVWDRIGDARWWDAVAEVLGRSEVKPTGLGRFVEALPRCAVATLFTALVGLAQGYDDHYRAGVCTLLDAAFARDPAEAAARLEALLAETVPAFDDDVRGDLPYDADRSHRVRRLGHALAVAIARRAGQAGEEPDPRIDALMKHELGLSDTHDLECTREAFAALPLGRREGCLLRGYMFTRGLAVAALAMTPKIVDAMIEGILRWSPKYGGPADQVVEALAHGGTYAREALHKALVHDSPHRPVFARALGRHPHPAVAHDLAQFAQGAPKSARPAYVEALVGQGDHGLTAAATLLASKKADARELAVEVLQRLAAQPAHAEAVRALAAERAETERSATLRTTLQALAEAPAGEEGGAPADDFEAELAALAAQIPEEGRGALRQAIFDTQGAAAREQSQLGPAVLPYLLEWVRKTGPNDKRYEGYYPFMEALERHYDHPLAPRIAVAGFFALGDKKTQAGKGFTRLLRLANARPLAWNDLPWPERNRRHAAVGAEVRARLIEALSAELPPQREYVLEWLAEQAPVEAAGAFVRALGDSARGMRELAVKVLTEAVTPDEALAAKVAAQLADKAKTTRLAAAMVLAAWRLPATAEAVGRALAKEKQPEVAAELQRALPPTAAPVAQPTAVAETAAETPAETPAEAHAEAAGVETEAALDARIAGLKAPKPPRWLAVAGLPVLRWRGGTALSEGATRWFLGWLGQESDTRHDAELVAVRARILDEDCHALCDAIRAQWRAGGSAKSAMEFVLAQQAVLGSEARMHELGSEQQNWYDAKSYKANQLAMEVFARHGGYRALAWLEHWAARARGGQFTKAVTAAAEAVSARRGAPLEELVDAAVPREGDGADLVNWQRDRWELAMVVGRRFPVALWRGHFVDNPLLRDAARAVVFRAVETGALFRTDPTWGAVDAEGVAVSFDGVTAVEIVHPAAMTEAEVAAWRTVLTKTLSLTGTPLGPFGQLSRKVFRAAPGVDPLDARIGKGVSVNARSLVQKLRAARFEPGELIDGGSYGKGVRKVSRHWRVEVHHHGIAAQTSMVGPREKVDVTSVSLRRGDEWVNAQDAPAGLVSEAMVLLEELLQV